MSEPTSTRQAAIEASIGSVQRIATRIIDLPNDQREAALEIVHREYMEAAKKSGFDDERGRAWADLQTEGIKALIAEIEKSGGGHGGTA
jgi:hypothetical protein